MIPRGRRLRDAILLGHDYADEFVARNGEKGAYRWVYRTALADFDEMTRDYAARGLESPVTSL